MTRLDALLKWAYLYNTSGIWDSFSAFADYEAVFSYDEREKLVYEKCKDRWDCYGQAFIDIAIEEGLL